MSVKKKPISRSSSYALFITTCGSAKEASIIAKRLVQVGAVACVNIVPRITSHYRWQGKLETTQECLLLMKSVTKNQKMIENVLKQDHSYTVPELICIKITDGSKNYLKWMNKNLRCG